MVRVATRPAHGLEFLDLVAHDMERIAYGRIRIIAIMRRSCRPDIERRARYQHTYPRTKARAVAMMAFRSAKRDMARGHPRSKVRQPQRMTLDLGTQGRGGRHAHEIDGWQWHGKHLPVSEDGAHFACSASGTS